MLSSTFPARQMARAQCRDDRARNTLPTLIAVSPDDENDRLAYGALFPTIPASAKKVVLPKADMAG